MAAQKPVYVINPHKFTIYDSELSDADSDSDEWVSISTSISSGTVPNHIALRPRTHNTRPISADKKAQLESPSKLAVERAQVTRPALINSTSSQATEVGLAALSPISALKLHLPSLQAIYIVNPSSIYPTCRQYLNSAVHGPFSSLTQTMSPPIGLHTPTNSECYLRVCADCVRGHIVLFCDQTWHVDQIGACDEHTAMFQEGGDPGIRAVRDRDRGLFANTVEAVQPFRQAESERSGVRVFNMTEVKAGEGYKHREGCGCAER